MLAEERRAGLEDLPTYFDFVGRVQRTKRELLYVLIKAKEKGKRICGYGAPGKGNALLNYAAIGTDFLDFTVDRNPYKHGRYTPGMHVPIYPVEAIDEVKPDYILILPWNLKDEIVRQVGVSSRDYCNPEPHLMRGSNEGAFAPRCRDQSPVLKERCDVFSFGTGAA